MNNSIGFKIKKLREQKEISQEDLAFQLDISQSYLSKIENGSIEKIDFLFMQRVAEFFKVEPQYFLEGDTVINDIETSNNSAVGYFRNYTINNNIDGDLFKSFVQNQEQITKQQEQISQLMEMQNKLIEKLLKN
ncbi:Transcriptional regulator, contains XRE-family HTH domain [Chryseobacterium wanjuense]|jgi:transcriptional regulator with XRE-family HTH domain|uniref:Transcriptional regulator, contains XRE-family HTH domain n=1 Tax=Chryseobacterium wanjuense TaxID=356305 RepID=A0A1I0NIE1_9FLAO|nr:helix-turn-helix domain-containing protein [Chryseobacterium wanjuense]SEW01229.1 Transcriptional regulator, contains XRE-family HTH domain [Chryseobacterium wanjuense]